MIQPIRIIPDNPINFIQQCVKDQQIFWTYHVNLRMKGRFIPREFIIESIEYYEIIEEYPEDKYFPSYLIYSTYQGKGFHVLFATDVEGSNVRIITAYFPNRNDWGDDLKTRRRS